MCAWHWAEEKKNMERDKLSKATAKLSHSQYNDDLNINQAEEEYEGEDHQIKKNKKLNDHGERRGRPRGRPRGRGRPRLSDTVALIIRSPSASADEPDDDKQNHRRGRKKKNLRAVVAAAAGGTQEAEGVLGGSVLGNGQFRSKRFSGSPPESLRDYKKEKQTSDDATEPISGKSTEQQMATPIPESKLLELVLDKLQKKDKYEVFAEPVDREEVPDYYDYIIHPMDFGTIRLKLSGGEYANLEQFEEDVFLICSNAMSYNASSTIYYRHARAIQELAQKYFQMLRLDPEKFHLEHKSPSNPKCNHSGQKNPNRTPSGRLHLESGGPDLASGETLATNANYANLLDTYLQDSVKLKKGDASERSGTGFEYSNGTGYQWRNNVDGNSLAVDIKADHSEVFSASVPKTRAVKDGRRAVIWEEERRDTYRPWNDIANGDESVFATPGGMSKCLIPIGFQSESAYAKSLARFSADLGPVAWKIAAQKIKKVWSSGAGSHLESNRGLHATSVDLFSIEKNKVQPKPVSAAIQTDEGLSRFNGILSSQLGRNERFLIKGSCEGQSNQLTSTMLPTNSKSPTNSDALRTSANSCFLRSNQSVKLNSVREPTMELPVETTKDMERRSGNSITADNKFTSEVSQSRLLEIVSRNNKLMQWMPTQQADGGQSIMNFRVSDSHSVATDRGGPREVFDTSKLPTSSASSNVALTGRNTSIHDYQDRSIAASSTRPAGENFAARDLNYLNQSDNSRMFLSLQKTSPDIYAGTSSSIETIVTQEQNAMQPYIRSQNLDIANLDAGSQSAHNTLQNVSSASLNSTQSETQLRPFSSISQFMQQKMLLGMPSYLQSQAIGMNPQISSMVTLSNTEENAGQIFESQVPNRMANLKSLGGNDSSQSHLNPLKVVCSQENAGQLFESHVPIRMTNAKSLGGNESPQSHLNPLKVACSQEHFQKLSDLSHSTPSNICIGFQHPKSPVRESSETLVHSKQPDLALQL